jgi:hypothetical protein
MPTKNVSSADVAITIVDVSIQYAKTFPAKVTVEYLNADTFSSEQYLSYHVYEENGEMLIMENVRIPILFPKSAIDINIDLSVLPEGRENAVVIFDIVDQDDGFWFSLMPGVSIFSDEITHKRDDLCRSIQLIKTSIKESRVIFMINLFVLFAVIIFVMWVCRQRLREAQRDKFENQTKGTPTLKNSKPLKNGFIFMLLLALPMFVYLRYPLHGLSLVDIGDGIQFFTREFFQSRNILDGDFAMWNKYIAGGTPAVAGSTFYLPSLFLGFLPPHWFVYFYYCLHIALGAFFFCLFLRELRCNLTATLVVSIIYLFSIHIGGVRKTHMSIITAIVMMPAAMYFIQKFLNSDKLKWLMFSSLFLALAFMGSPQTAIYISSATFLYYIAMSAYNKQKIWYIIRNCAIFTASSIGFASVVILSMLEIARTYAAHGSADTSFATFTSYSIHPVKLIQMIFPYFFGESIFENFTPAYSSGFDIELFIGVIALMVILFAAKRYWKEFQIKLFIALCAIAFAYAAIAHIPALREIVYRIPVLGDFRVPSRALPVFLFFLYVILAFGLTKIREPEELENFMVFQRKLSFGMIIIVGIVVTATFIVVHLYGFDIITLANYYRLSGVRFFMTIFGFAGAIFLGCSFIKRFYKGSKDQGMYSFFAALLLMITLLETWSFSSMTSSAPINEMVKNNEAISHLTNDIGDAKIFDAFPGMDGAHQSIISQGKNILSRISSINAYIAFNNPILYKMISGDGNAPLNSSGLLTGSLNARDNVLLQNDLLSMLDVKYVIDTERFIPDNGTIPDSRSERSLIYENAGFSLSSSTDNVALWADAVSVKSWQHYLVVFDIETGASGGILYADLYGGENYDIALSQQEIRMRSGPVKLLLGSGDSTLSQGEIYLRVVSVGLEGACAIKNLRLFELLNTNGEYPTYAPYIIDDQNRIFENLNARGILYFSDKLKGIDRIEDILAYPYGLSLDKISYVAGASDEIYDVSAYKIDDVDFRNNAISATIINEEAGFLNFSQCYFPGWKVYVDGKREKLEVVNALIMGVKLPPGAHQVEFRFVSVSFVWGIIITIVCTASWIIVLGVLKKRDRKANYV